MENNIQSRTFPAQVAHIETILDYICEQAELAGLHPKRVMHLQLALEEAIVNISNYAYEIPPGEIEVQLEQDAKRFKVSLVDSGVPFDPLATDEPNLAAGVDERKIGGLGILFIRRIMDEVHYSRDGAKNIISLVVYKEQ